MSLFLAALPVWVAALLVVVLPTALAMCGPLLIRRHYRPGAPGNQQRDRRLQVRHRRGALRRHARLRHHHRLGTLQRCRSGRGAGGRRGRDRVSARRRPGATGRRHARRAALATWNSSWPGTGRRWRSRREDHEVTRALDDLYAATLSLAQECLASAGGAAGDIQPARLGHAGAPRPSAPRPRHRAHEPVVVLVLGGMLTVGFTFFFGTRNLQAQMP